jgi:rhamnosyltransferase
MSKKILVLLATHNGSIWLRELIDSILNQKDADVYIVASDDQSCDNTLRILSEYAAINDRFSILNADVRHGGASKNFYYLIRNVDFNYYDYIAFADQDDIWLNDKLSRAVKVLMNSEGFLGYSSAVEAFWPNCETRILKQSSGVVPLDFVFEGAGQGCTFVVDKKLMLQVQAFIQAHFLVINEFFFHDWLIYLLSRCWNFLWFFDPVPSVLYRQHAKNVNGARRGIRSILFRFRLIKNGWYRQQIILAIQIATLASGNSSNLDSFKYLYLSNRNLSRRLKLFSLLFRRSRRKFLDRVIISLCVFLDLI